MSHCFRLTGRSALYQELIPDFPGRWADDLEQVPGERDLDARESNWKLFQFCGLERKSAPFEIKVLLTPVEINGVKNDNESIEAGTAASESADLELQIERLSALIVGTTPDDLPALAAIHGGFQEIAALQQDAARSCVACRTGRKARVELISQIILRERDDTAAALEAAGRIVREMQGVIDGTPILRSLLQASLLQLTQSPQPAADTNSEECVFGAGDVPLAFMNSLERPAGISIQRKCSC